MKAGFNRVTGYRAILKRDAQYDGIFYFAVKATNLYCRPSCTALRPLRQSYSFFATIEEVKSHGYQPCKHCHPNRLKNDLSQEILQNIDAGVVNDKGVHGLANSLHISERHLRRVVHARTGTTPVELNKMKRLSAATVLIKQTKLPITEVAFNVGFSSLRQFNDVFKQTFNTSPREMRKATALIPKKQSSDSIALPLRLIYEALLRAPLKH